MAHPREGLPEARALPTLAGQGTHLAQRDIITERRPIIRAAFVILSLILADIA